MSCGVKGPCGVAPASWRWGICLDEFAVRARAPRGLPCAGHPGGKGMCGCWVPPAMRYVAPGTGTGRHRQWDVCPDLGR